MSPSIDAYFIRNSDLVEFFDESDIKSVVTKLSYKMGFTNFRENIREKESDFVLILYENIKKIIKRTKAEMILTKNHRLKKNCPKDYRAIKTILMSKNKEVNNLLIEKEENLSKYLDTDDKKLAKFLNKKNSDMSTAIEGLNNFLILRKKLSNFFKLPINIVRRIINNKKSSSDSTSSESTPEKINEGKIVSLKIENNLFQKIMESIKKNEKDILTKIEIVEMSKTNIKIILKE
uniref:Uncharacterized protein n=1 Tax=Strongyloides stercoralis TaxID=6248 RepID=A0A0K0EGD7_STRER